MSSLRFSLHKLGRVQHLTARNALWSESVIWYTRSKHKVSGFDVVSGDFDLSTPEGGFIFTLHAALSELERRKLGKRTKEGLAAARAIGVKLGRPRKLTESDVQLTKTAIQIGGLTRKSVAAQLGVSTRTLARAFLKGRYRKQNYQVICT